MDKEKFEDIKGVSEAVNRKTEDTTANRNRTNGQRKV
jgi:hypothetical protein